MFLEITDFSDKKAFAEFDEFARKFGEFTQSPRWTSVKRRWQGAGVVVRNPDGAVTAECLVLIRKTPFGSLMYSPRGFIGEYSSEVWAEILSGIEILSRKYHAVEFIFDPRQSADFLKKYKRDDIKPVQPKENVILRIAKPFSEIERGFKSDYRNRIRKAVKRGVRFEVHGKEALDEFYELYAETGRRGKFPVRSKEYFSEILRAFGCECKIFLCRNSEGKALSGAVGIAFGTRFTYVYGGSSSAQRNLYPNYLMQSEMIKFARNIGCTEYDFGRIPDYKNENSAGYRLWRFKSGFGGEIAEYDGEFAVVFRKFTAKFLRRALKLRKKFHSIFTKNS